MKELIEIQSKLKAPKSQFNKFGNYNYRNQEDILEALKPLLKENGCHLIVSDELVIVGERIYIKATATISKENISISAIGFAREDEQIKGMSTAQITGSTSSYARKYALNGLFCIDDNKDDDNTNTHGKDEKQVESKEQPKKEFKQDDRPWLNEEDFKKILNRIGAGNEEAYSKSIEFYKMKKEYRKSLEDAQYKLVESKRDIQA